MFPAFEQGFINIALVEFRVAGDGDVPPRQQPFRQQIFQPCVILHQRRKTGGGDAQADRAGGKIDFRAVLDPARVGLRAAEFAEIPHLFDRLPPEQVVGGVEHRACVRFDGDAILRPEFFEIKRGEDRNDGGAACLVTADLQAVTIGPFMVGMVHHPGGEPQQLALDLPQGFEAGNAIALEAEGRCVHAKDVSVGACT